MNIETVAVRSILTRTSGYLDGIASHSLQPYRGCSFGNSLCGVGCYVQHNRYVTSGRPWGSFLEARSNAAEVYRHQYERERRWARERHGRFGIFCSSSTDPFVPQEARLRITASLLDAMLELPPDLLVVQTHSDRVASELVRLCRLADRCRVRIHLTIETDRESLEGLPPHATPIEKRFAAARQVKSAGLFTVITAAPLLPIADPEAFFRRVAESADAVVIDHFVGGDGSQGGARTLKTRLPFAMSQVHPGSELLSYRDEMIAAARAIMPGRVGIGAAGFGGTYG